MSSYSDINIRFSSDLTQFTKEIDRAYAKIKRMSEGLQTIGTTMSVALTLPIILLGREAINSYAKIEALQLGLKNVMGSATIAAQEYEKLLVLAKSPGIGLQEAVQGSIRLQTIGFSADQARVALSGLANAVASVGKGKFELDRAVYGLEQLANTEHPLQQDINILRNAIPQTVPILKKAFGEIRNVNAETLSAAGITSQQVVDALIAGYAELPKFAGGIINAFDNISDSYLKSTGAIGEAINKNIGLQRVFETLGNAMEGLGNWFLNLNPMFQELILVMVSAVAVMGPLAFAVGGVAKAMAFLNLSGLTLMSTFVAIVGVIAAVVFIAKLFSDEASSMAEVNLELANTMADADMSAKKSTQGLTELYEKVKDTTKSQNERNGALAEFNAMAGTSISWIDGETAAQKKLAQSYDDTKEAMESAARYKFYSDEEIRAEGEIAKAKAKAASDYKEAMANYNDVTVKVAGVDLPKKPLSALYLNFTGGLPGDVKKAGDKAISDTEHYLKEITKLKELYSQNGGKPGEGGKHISKEEQKRLAKEAEDKRKLMMRLEKESAADTLENRLKYTEIGLREEYKLLGKSADLERLVLNERQRITNKWYQERFNAEKESCDAIASVEKSNLESSLKRIELNQLEKTINAQSFRDATELGEYIYQQELFAIEQDADTARLLLYKAGSEEYLEIQQRMNDRRIANEKAANDISIETNKKYNNLLNKQAELEAREMTTKVAFQLEEIKKKIKEVEDYANKHGIVLTADTTSLSKSQSDLANFASAASQLVETFIEDQLISSLSKLGEAIAGVGDPFKEFGKTMLASLGDFMMKLGALMITTGISLGAFKEFLKDGNAVGIVVAGAALVVAGSAVSAYAKKGLESGGNSSAAASTSYTSSAPRNDDAILYSRLDGRDLILSGERTTYVRRR